MKNTIRYYYNLDDIYLVKSKGKTYVKTKGEIYLFIPVFNEKEIIEIKEILKEDRNFYPIILNNRNSIFTPYNGKNYILMKKTIYYTDSPYIKYRPLPFSAKNYLLNRSNWYFLWTEKIDYFEYQLNHIYGKYPIIDESIDYFIGMAECAISYLAYHNLINPSQDSITICHRRIRPDDVYNPLNLVLDHKERDAAEYLKYLFWHGKYTRENADKIIENFNNSTYNYPLLFARILYPSFYFDIYERIINERASEEELKKIILRIDKYEIFLKDIYEIISKTVEISKIDWITKA